MDIVDIPCGYVKIAIENGYRNSGFSDSAWWLSIVLLNYQGLNTVLCLVDDYELWYDVNMIDDVSAGLCYVFVFSMNVKGKYTPQRIGFVVFNYVRM